MATPKSVRQAGEHSGAARGKRRRKVARSTDPGDIEEQDKIKKPRKKKCVVREGDADQGDVVPAAQEEEVQFGGLWSLPEELKWSICEQLSADGRTQDVRNLYFASYCLGPLGPRNEFLRILFEKVTLTIGDTGIPRDDGNALESHLRLTKRFYGTITGFQTLSDTLIYLLRCIHADQLTVLCISGPLNKCTLAAFTNFIATQRNLKFFTIPRFYVMPTPKVLYPLPPGCHNLRDFHVLHERRDQQMKQDLETFFLPIKSPLKVLRNLTSTDLLQNVRIFVQLRMPDGKRQSIFVAAGAPLELCSRYLTQRDDESTIYSMTMVKERGSSSIALGPQFQLLQCQAPLSLHELRLSYMTLSACRLSFPTNISVNNLSTLGLHLCPGASILLETLRDLSKERRGCIKIQRFRYHHNGTIHKGEDSKRFFHVLTGFLSSFSGLAHLHLSFAKTYEEEGLNDDNDLHSEDEPQDSTDDDVENYEASKESCLSLKTMSEEDARQHYFWNVASWIDHHKYTLKTLSLIMGTDKPSPDDLAVLGSKCTLLRGVGVSLPAISQHIEGGDIGPAFDFEIEKLEIQLRYLKHLQYLHVITPEVEMAPVAAFKDAPPGRDALEVVTRATAIALATRSRTIQSLSVTMQKINIEHVAVARSLSCHLRVATPSRPDKAIRVDEKELEFDLECFGNSEKYCVSTPGDRNGGYGWT